jgi:hypothetical protein
MKTNAVKRSLTVVVLYKIIAAGSKNLHFVTIPFGYTMWLTKQKILGVRSFVCRCRIVSFWASVPRLSDRSATSL